FVEVLTNGEVFYEAQLEAIRNARSSINLEAYIFQRGKVTRRFVEALAERARAGVKVNMVLDAIGCFLTTRKFFKELSDAGGRVEWYHPFRWYNLPRLNNRTHRELLIIDGEIGFTGGAGFADHWLHNKRKHRRWRDSMFRVRGGAVKSLQSVFAENWLEASGEILTGARYFPVQKEQPYGMMALVVSSAPSMGRSTRARVLFQTLLATASKSIYITSPYFLPDKSVREELKKAIKIRQVEVKIITPGRHSDHLLTRRSSRRLYGELLRAGASIYEYRPTMIHTKSMIVDGVWSVVGTTNFDNRSFGLNDEVNLVVYDEVLTGRLQEDFAKDLAESHRVSYQQWKHRNLFERFHEWFGWILERQQ
ncbi:MAG TPA: phospholipase D-like domain-containing protein, partial [Acidobacteriota bacterium]|nr:phospholipase D-like domain-containing protein [Acidobacteriota bacterium]